VLVDPCRFVQDHPEVTTALLALLAAQREPFFTIETLGALVVDQEAFPAQQGMQHWGTGLAALFGKCSQS